MFSFFILFSITLGLIIGSFLNVVLFRHGSSRGLNGRSNCFACNKQLSWLELIPVISFFLQQGSCKGCKVKLSWQYPIVEIITAVLFGLITWRLWPAFDTSLFWAILSLLDYWLIVSVFVLIATYDLHHKIIPDEWVMILAFAGLLLPVVAGQGIGFIFFSLLNRALAGIVLGLFFWTIWHFSKGQAMGFGDVKLSISIGFILGLAKGITGIVFAFWAGAVVGILLIVASRNKWFAGHRKLITLKSEVPFAPFILFGAILSLLLNGNFFF